MASQYALDTMRPADLGSDAGIIAPNKILNCLDHGRGGDIVLVIQCRFQPRQVP